MSNCRGYLKDVDGVKRMRLVKPGYDANDENVPGNKVIFDSKDLGVMTILEVGEYHWTNVKDSGGLVRVRSWDYGFVPLCVFQWQINTQPYWSNHAVGEEAGADQLVKVALDGIYVSMIWSYFTVYPNIGLRWQAFRMPAI
ncbi:hypothetical protein EN836_33110 [Mesorhizobium sp. M1C.F.Ca.ET.193.01.1.1]|nr:MULTISPECIES: hypothetical protein [unclassified Mesorhizobium]TGR74914.1 hypothetical protein EN836_33110 [Mesorhizobium sp. M1C.F.Ca.ET.193.01.1.1]TGT64101.1 hypothetical protein EN809_035175 [Mesorhizobium sp. M2E.F.Ca.ET.166.01.1.1]TGV97016.1 hypothetical protein EN797_034990 [Mesorhizobium sp. M2E.F.Ca.ET.154.01.1.1]